MFFVPCLVGIFVIIICKIKKTRDDMKLKELHEKMLGHHEDGWEYDM